MDIEYLVKSSRVGKGVRYVSIEGVLAEVERILVERLQGMKRGKITIETIEVPEA